MSDWRLAGVSSDGTHHVIAGVPLYEARFDEVLKFHPPGLAAVRRAGAAWHIDVRGEPVYATRFLRTFGFYEGRAAVVAGDGWHHIWPGGEALYGERYGWCGNYQGSRVAVRNAEGRYLHLDLEGRPLYMARWRYAGDYRDGIAVVQGDGGRSTHVDEQGELLHGCWFLDLDVYHKGLARARDERGWMHIDREGRPIYARRFAMVEPFYNGQARVEGEGGELAVIDEHGETVAMLRPPLASDFARLSADLVGFWKTQTIATAVEVGLFEALPGTSEELAVRCGLPAGSTLRLVRAAGELGLVERAGGEARFRTSPRGEFLRRDHPLTLADAAIEYARYLAPAWEALPSALRQGETWRATDVFGEVARDPTRCVPHHRMLRSYALHDYSLLVPLLKFHGSERVLDAGGGVGALAGLLLATFPRLEVVVLDRPGVVAEVSVARYPGQLHAQAADLFSPWPTKGDVVILARVLHDWDDEGARVILGHARDALRLGGRLLLLEMLLDETHWGGSLCDLHLLAVTGGRERMAAEFAALLDVAGFRLTEVREGPALPRVLEALPR